MGTPTIKSFTNLTLMKNFNEKLPFYRENKLEYCFLEFNKYNDNILNNDAIDLLNKMLVVDPTKRISFEEIIEHVNY